MGSTELHRPEYNIKIYLEETQDKGTHAHTHKVQLAPDATQLGKGGGLTNHYKQQGKLVS
jgi:hypothetical protein